MPQELQILKELQALDRERRELLSQRQQLDEEMGGLKGEFNRVAAMAAVLDEAIPARRAERQELAGKIEHERGLAARAESRLPQIKTQREYLAVLKEVDAAKKQIKEIGDLIKKIPGINKMMPQGLDGAEDELKYTEAIILSMTIKERRNPVIINGSRRRRIADGSGTSVQEVNALLKEFEKMKKMMKQMMKGAKGGKGMPRAPFPPMPGF